MPRMQPLIEGHTEAELVQMAREHGSYDTIMPDGKHLRTWTGERTDEALTRTAKAVIAAHERWNSRATNGVQPPAPTVVYEVHNRVFSMLYTNEADAQRMVAAAGATAGLTITPRPVHGVQGGAPMGKREMLQREWRGRRVELLRDMKTKSGTEFKAGEVLVSACAYRGKLSLHDPATMKGNLITRAISRVSMLDVRLLPDEPATAGVSATAKTGDETRNEGERDGRK